MEECVQTTRTTQRDMKEAVRAITGTKPASAAFKKKYNKKRTYTEERKSKQPNKNQQQNTAQVLSLSLSLLSLPSLYS